MFVNFSNHPAEKWTEEQKNAAEKYGEIRDVTFPEVDPTWSERSVGKLAEECAAEILECEPDFVLCQGEFCLAFAVTEILKRKGVRVGAACSRRICEEHVEEGVTKKTLTFKFVQFREY